METVETTYKHIVQTPEIARGKPECVNRNETHSENDGIVTIKRSLFDF